MDTARHYYSLAWPSWHGVSQEPTNHKNWRLAK